MSQIDNFKGKIHKLTREDCVKGGKRSSEKKAFANSIKNLIHGNNSDNLYFLLRCVDCPAIGRCEKKHDGYCTYLLEEMKLNRDFSKQVTRCLFVNKETVDPIQFLQEKYRLNKEYIEKLFPSDSNG